MGARIVEDDVSLGWIFSQRQRERGQIGVVQNTSSSATRTWYDEMVLNARAHGAYPYIVEGFMEITEAVRRGHSVLIRREAAEVADGVEVFATSEPGPLEQVGLPAPAGEPIATILSFNMRTARFVIQDPQSIVGSVELTPKRLQRYLAAEGRDIGVALGS